MFEAFRRSSKPSELSSSVNKERERIKADIAKISERNAVCYHEMQEIAAMTSGKEEFTQVMEKTFSLLRDSAMNKLKVYFNNVLSSDDSFHDEVPKLIMMDSRSTNAAITHFPYELAIAFMDVPSVVDQLMKFAGWTTPRLNRQERSARSAELNRELEANGAELQTLRSECETAGIIWPE